MSAGRKLADADGQAHAAGEQDAAGDQAAFHLSGEQNDREHQQ
jgi:hypothetical protein